MREPPELTTSAAARRRAWAEFGGGDQRMGGGGRTGALMMGGGTRTARLGRRRGGSAAAGWVDVRGRVWGALSRAVRRGGAREAFSFSRAVGSARRTACGTGRRVERRQAGGGGRTGERKKGLSSFFLHFILFRSRDIQCGAHTRNAVALLMYTVRNIRKKCNGRMF
jgi:hypothetical protein